MHKLAVKRATKFAEDVKRDIKASLADDEELGESFESQVNARDGKIEGSIGTDESKALWVEFGSATRPPNPFMREALRRNAPR